MIGAWGSRDHVVGRSKVSAWWRLAGAVINTSTKIVGTWLAQTSRSNLVCIVINGRLHCRHNLVKIQEVILSSKAVHGWQGILRHCSKYPGSLFSNMDGLRDRSSKEWKIKLLDCGEPILDLLVGSWIEGSGLVLGE